MFPRNPSEDTEYFFGVHSAFVKIIFSITRKLYQKVRTKRNAEWQAAFPRAVSAKHFIARCLSHYVTLGFSNPIIFAHVSILQIYSTV